MKTDWDIGSQIQWTTKDDQFICLFHIGPGIADVREMFPISRHLASDPMNFVILSGSYELDHPRGVPLEH